MTDMQTDGNGLDIFYPIAPDASWIQRIVPLGVRTVQLRAKNMNTDELRHQISSSLEICDKYNCQLIINDHWCLAIEAGACFIHLGQEDLADADLGAIRAARVKLGISTHSKEELRIAQAAMPDYIALGPIYETKLKAMKWAPQGLQQISVWKNEIGDIPLVGIAGITIARAGGVIASGAQSVAVITDFFTHPEPERRVEEWLEWAAEHRT